MKFIKFFKITLFIFISLILTIFIANLVVKNNAKNKLFDSVNAIPENRVGVLLGTSKYLSNGQINLYYQYRLDATITLFRAGKIKYILVSADNTGEYDESTTFKKDLINSGIPADNIVLDYAGFRTLDSVVRANKIFGLKSYVIISQKFHNERAIYLAEYFGMDVVGYNAKSVTGSRLVLRVQLREYLARVKVFVDIVIRKKPKFLGERIKIG